MSKLFIEDIINDKQLINYIKANPQQDEGLSSLFPNRHVDDLKAEINKFNFNQDTSAEFYPFDVPTKIGQREGFEGGEVELNLIKEKMALNEREIYYIENPRSTGERKQLIEKLYRDVEAIRGRILTRIERLRYEVLTTGKAVINENGLKAQVDFGVNHRGNHNWLTNKSVDIFDELRTIQDTIENDTGFRVTRLMTTPKVMQAILKLEEVKLQVWGDSNKSRMVTKGQLNSLLTEYDLPNIYTNHKTYKTKKMVKGKIVDTFVNYFPENTFVAMPDGPLGETLRGLTPEELELRKHGFKVEGGDITLTTYADPDPVRRYVKGSATAFVTLPYGEQLYIGSVQ